MASKIYSGGLLGAQAAKNTFLKASRIPQGPPLGGYLEAQILGWTDIKTGISCGPGFPRLQKTCLQWIGILKCKACKQDELQSKTEVADMLRNDLASCSASNNDSKFLLLGTRE